MGEKIGKTMKSNQLLLLILISLVIIGLIILTNIISFSNIGELIIEQIKENQLTQTEFAANQIENHIIQVKDELVTLSKFPSMATLDINECTGDMRIINEKIEGRIDSLLRIDEQGNIIECSSPDFSNYVGLNVKNKDYFSVPKETNEPYIVGMVRQGTSRQIIVTAPLFETISYTPYPNFIGEFKGVLMSIIELDHLHNLYLHRFVDSERNFFLLINLDTEETLIKSDNIGDFKDILEYLPETDNGWDTITEYSDFGQTIITSSDLIFGFETWRLIVLTPLKNTEADISAVQTRHFLSLSFIIVVIIVVFLFLISLYQSKEEIQSKLDHVSVTLDELGINIGIEKDKFSQAEMVLENNKIYLVKEDEENHAHELFIDTLNKGYAGLGIVREDPRKIKKKYNLQKTSFIWLTKTKIEGMPAETDINALFNFISAFVKKSSKSVILIDRLDYILSENEFSKVIKIIYSLKDLVLANNCIIILSVDPDLISETSLKSIEAETIDLYGKHLRKKVDLSDIERGILQYTNENNVVNKLVSFKDITQKFDITKPTTRAKINRLQSLGLLNVEKKGRYKAIKITSAGRRIIG